MGSRLTIPAICRVKFDYLVSRLNQTNRVCHLASVCCLKLDVVSSRY